MSIDQNELKAFLKRPSPPWKFKGLPNALRAGMERTANRGPTPDELRDFVDRMRNRKPKPKDAM